MNEQGRRKAQFLVNAVTHYMNCPETPEAAAAPRIDRQTVEQLVREILSNMHPEPVPAMGEDITVNAHHFADMLYEYIRCNTPDDVKIKVSFEKEKLLNTGGALRKATEYLLSDGYNNNVLVHNVDILSNVNLKKFYVNSSALRRIPYLPDDQHLTWD